MKTKSFIAAVLCAMLLCGCGGGAIPDGTTVPTEPPVLTTVAPTETTAPVQTIPAETESVLADDALSLLRADMKPHMAALGYLGYCDLEKYDSPMAYLQGEFPNYLASNAYLSGVSKVYGNYGSLYCVVPKDPNARVTVNHVKFEGMYPYKHLRTIEADAPGEPFFVLCVVDDEALLEVIITEPDGRTLRWYPPEKYSSSGSSAPAAVPSTETTPGVFPKPGSSRKTKTSRSFSMRSMSRSFARPGNFPSGMRQNI